MADAISETYPDSPYLISLRNDVARMEARTSLLQSIQERSYPDLAAPDMYGNEIKLSSLDGYVVLVDFWSAELGNSNALNADLKEIYHEYESKGFRVYQVSVDTVKSTWINAVQEQRLPWISVCDFRGEASPLLGTYNVKKLPSNYLIDATVRLSAKTFTARLSKRDSPKYSNRPQCTTSHRTYISEQAMPQPPEQRSNAFLRGSPISSAMPKRYFWSAIYSIFGSNIAMSFRRVLCAYSANWHR